MGYWDSEGSDLASLFSLEPRFGSQLPFWVVINQQIPRKFTKDQSKIVDRAITHSTLFLVSRELSIYHLIVW